MKIKFYVIKRDYFAGFDKNKKTVRRLREGSSVIAYKKFFFDCLRKLGEVILIKEDLNEKKLSALLNKSGAVLVSVNFPIGGYSLSKVSHRVLKLSLGSLLFPDNLNKVKSVPSASVYLVSTQFQLGRTKSYLGRLAPKMEVFPFKVDTDYFVLPNKQQRLIARKEQKIGKGQLHIVYAGRWIVTKGICQLIRALDIWPLPNNVVLTLAGNIEKDNTLAFSLANHATFSRFLNDEILRNKNRPWLRFQHAKDKKGLRDLFWSADLFVNLSIQPDENFGITPRQAMACGLPIVTTNFCGLRILADNMPWKGVDTYPTYSGSRFSLKQFRVLLEKAMLERNLLFAQEYRNIVIKEFKFETSNESLKRAIKYLLKRPTERFVDSKDMGSGIKKQFLSFKGKRDRDCFTDKIRKRLSKGICVYGNEPVHYTLPLVQGIYSASSIPPKVKKGSKWCGFFRIALLDEERALIEFGFPGPRIRRYSAGLWNSLVECTHYLGKDEYVISPEEKSQIAIVQNLVDLGFLVSEDH